MGAIILALALLLRLQKGTRLLLSVNQLIIILNLCQREQSGTLPSPPKETQPPPPPVCSPTLVIPWQGENIVLYKVF